MTSNLAASASEPYYRHVAVPLDGSAFAEAAVPTARALAERFDAELHAVSVANDEKDVDALRTGAAAALKMVGAAGEDQRVHVVVGSDAAAGVATKAAELGSTLVCLSTHGRGRLVGALIGSVARSLLQQAREPIVAVGPLVGRPHDFVSTPPPPLSVPRLVACVDGTGSSERVLPLAAAWAKALGMTLTVITVAEPRPPPLRADAAWLRAHGPREDADAWAARLAERWRHAAAAFNVHVVYDPLSPAEGVKSYLAEHPAGMIALTTHARSGLKRAVLGANAAAIVHASTAPALVMPLTG